MKVLIKKIEAVILDTYLPSQGPGGVVSRYDVEFILYTDQMKLSGHLEWGEELDIQTLKDRIITLYNEEDE